MGKTFANMSAWVIAMLVASTKGIHTNTWQYWVLLLCLGTLQIINSEWRD